MSDQNNAVSFIAVITIMISTFKIIYACLCLSVYSVPSMLTLISGLHLVLSIITNVSNYRRDRYMLAFMVFCTYMVMICDMTFFIWISNMGRQLACTYRVSIEATNVASLILGTCHFMSALNELSKPPRPQRAFLPIDEVPPPYQSLRSEPESARSAVIHIINQPSPPSPACASTASDQPLLPQSP